jgi:transcriptional regulator with XRE-family HTH domain
VSSRANDVGDLIRGAREAAALTQQELAEAACLSVRALSNLECGHVALPRVHTLRHLARALGYDAEAGRRFVLTVRAAAGHCTGTSQSSLPGWAGSTVPAQRGSVDVRPGVPAFVPEASLDT